MATTFQPHGCRGPKLGKFHENFQPENIDVLEIIQHDGKHSIVTKTRIAGEIYAVKLFFDFGHEYYDELPYRNDGNPENRVKYQHTFPFFNECRAYGRLKELGRENLAAKAYGYVYVSLSDAMQEKILAAKTTRPKSVLDLLQIPEAHQNVHIWGIVKEFVNTPEIDVIGMTRQERFYATLYKPRYFRKMLQDVRALHKCGIVLRDVSLEQFVEGKLVDFSSAWTVPHVYNQGWTFLSYAAGDFWCFQHYVIEEWKHRGFSPPKRQRNLRAYPDPAARRRLRSSVRACKEPLLPISLANTNRTQEEILMIEPPPYDPGSFLPNKTFLLKG